MLEEFTELSLNGDFTAPEEEPHRGRPRSHGSRGPEYEKVLQERQAASLDTENLVAGFPALHRQEGFVPTKAVGLKNEQPWHRMAAYMLNAGRSNQEIAKAAGVTPTMVSVLRSQRWFQELCAYIANTEGGEILGLLRSEAAASIETVVQLRDTAESERVRLAAATYIVDQAHGKAVQKVLSIHGNANGFASEQDELNAIQEELALLRKQNEKEPK